MPTPRPPLQILVFGDFAGDDDAKSMRDALTAAISVGRSAGGYVPSMDDLGIEFKAFGADVVPSAAPDDLLDTFQHALVVVLVSFGWVSGSTNGAYWAWLERCWGNIEGSDDRHHVLPILLDDRAMPPFVQKSPKADAFQTLQASDFGERAIRPAMFALRVLHECRVLLAPVNGKFGGPPPGFMRLFISHAKLDGLPLAQALKHQIQQISWLKSFYDADDLAPGSQWRKELEVAVGASIIVILRTEYYDQRYWCQQEVLWSEEYATPAIMVEARTGLNHPAGILPFDRVPTVRIPDGNLMRIVFLAVREGLRFLYFIAKVEEMKRFGGLPKNTELRVFCSAPSMPGLLRACQALQPNLAEPDRPRVILYPDPPLRAGLREAAAALVERYASGAQLLTPLTISSTTPVSPS